MTAYRLTELWCDECYDKLAEEGNFADVRKQAVDDYGWTRQRGRDLCARCTEKAAS